MAINRKDVIYFVLTDRFHGVENPRPELREKIDKANPKSYPIFNTEVPFSVDIWHFKEEKTNKIKERLSGNANVVP